MYRALRMILVVLCIVTACIRIAKSAEPVCYQYRYSFPSPGGAWFDSKSDAASSLVAKLNDPATNVNIDDCQRGNVQAGGGTITYTAAEISGSAPGELEGVVHCTISGVTGTFAYLNGTHDAPYSAFSWRVNPDECPEEHCERTKSESFTTQYNAANDYCHAIDHCKVEKGPWVQVGDALLIKWTITTQDCGDTPSDSGAPVEEDQQDETCDSSGGNEFCISKDGDNCGYLNDQFICLPKTNHDGCKVFGDGSRVCGPESPIPPAPDSGTSGQPAMPDGTVQSTVGGITTVYNYYNATTVSNSSRDPGTSGDNPYDGDDDGDGGDGGDSCSGEECAPVAASGGQTCDAAPQCEGDAIMCAVLDQEWRNRCDQEISSTVDMPGEVGLPTGDEDGTGVPGTEVEVSESFDSTGWLSEECPSDVTIDVGSYGTIEIPLSDMCEVLRMLGLAVMAVAYFRATQIVFGGF